MTLKVAKFGGTSLSDAAQARKALDIVAADATRRYVVPSAPGKRHAHDQKVTDLLLLCHEHARQEIRFDEVFDLIATRFTQLAATLGAGDVSGMLDQARAGIAAAAANGEGPDFAASRGEHLNGRILAAALDWPFVDPIDLIRFEVKGGRPRLDEATTYHAVGEALRNVERAVIPGFYGGTAEGRVCTFSRGGSDVSGAIIARGVGASIYENWTDVSGLLMADPRIVDRPRTIETLTYRELRELAYMGATVLHDEAVFPVRAAGIPVHIRNTNQPDAPGTQIVRGDDLPPPSPGTISGIAGRKDFTSIQIERTMMNAELGFGRRVLNVLEANGVSFEHMPSGIDTLSVIVGDAELEGKLDRVLAELHAECHPDGIEVDGDLALIATVGRGMAHTPGTAAKLFAALAGAGVNIRLIDQGSSELNIIVGVNTGQFEQAVRAIYAAFVQGEDR